MMKIAFSGTPKSGKTSLITEVKKILSLKYNVELVDEITHKSPYDNSRKSEFKSQFFFLTTQINDENIKAITGPDLLLCDRSVLDQWVYWNKHIAGKKLSPQMTEKNNLLEQLYRYWIQTYDMIFFIRLDSKEFDRRIDPDEFRSVNADYIKKVEEIFLKIISEDNMKVNEIWNNNTIDESAQNVIQLISEKMDANQ
jgi:deoxyadenosine/deoxycytidine kinase